MGRRRRRPIASAFFRLTGRLFWSRLRMLCVATGFYIRRRRRVSLTVDENIDVRLLSGVKRDVAELNVVPSAACLEAKFFDLCKWKIRKNRGCHARFADPRK